MIPERSKELQTFCREHLERRETVQERPVNSTPNGTVLQDSEILEKLQRQNDGGKAARLLAGDGSGYESPSHADLALTSCIAFYTQDPDQILRIWMGSGLAREKSRTRPDYQRRTINQAMVREGGSMVAHTNGSPRGADQRRAGDERHHSGRHRAGHGRDRTGAPKRLSADAARGDDPGRGATAGGAGRQGAVARQGA